MTGEDGRLVEVDPERLGRWVAGFAERHGSPLTVSAVPGGTLVRATDGARAGFAGWPEPGPSGVPAGPGPGGSAEPPEGAAADQPGGAAPTQDPAALGQWLTTLAAPPGRLALALVRRGGYAVGLAEGPRLARHRCGTRYVQSRTAAGGWSQQRFARRRSNQADALLVTVAERLRTLLVAEQHAPRPAGLVVGGDRALTARLLELLTQDAVTRDLPDLPRRELPDLPDPRLEVLRTALRRGRAVRVRVVGPA